MPPSSKERQARTYFRCQPWFPFLRSSWRVKRPILAAQGWGHPQEFNLFIVVLHYTASCVWPPAELQSDRPWSAPFRPRLLSDSGERCALRTAASIVGYSDNSFTRSRGSWLEPQADRATPSPASEVPQVFPETR